MWYEIKSRDMNEKLKVLRHNLLILVGLPSHKDLVVSSLTEGKTLREESKQLSNYLAEPYKKLLLTPFNLVHVDHLII